MTGDAANITLKIEQDDDGTQSASNDVNPTEVEDGQYRFDLTQAETNGDKLTFYPESSTAGVQVVALPSNVIYTRPQYFADLGIESDGHVHGDVKQVAGQTASATGAVDFDDLATIETVTTAIGATGSGLSAIPWNPAWDAEVQSECADALTAFGWSGITISAVSGAVGSVTGAVGSVTAGVTVTTNNDKTGYSISGTIQTLDALDAAQDAQHSTTQAAVAGISAGSAPTLLQTATISTLASQTSFTLSAGSTDDSAYKNQIAIIVDQSTSTQKTVCNISSYTGSTRTVTLSDSPAFTVATGDTVYVVAASKTTLTDDVVNSITGTTVRHAKPTWTGAGWDSSFIKGDSYLGGLAPSITITNWAGDQLISAASEIKLSGTKTVGGTTTTFSWDLTPGDVTVDGSTTTIPVAVSATDTAIDAGEYEADLRATWTSPAETVSLIQPRFKLRIDEPVSTF